MRLNPGKKTTTEAPQKLSRLERMQETLKEVRKRAKSSFYKLTSGRTVIRILPPIEEDGDWYFRSYLHYRIGPDSYAVCCPNLMLKKKCPICEKITELAEGDETERKIAKALDPKLRVYANAFIKDSGVKVLPFGKTVFEALLSHFTDPEWGDLDDIETGHNITIVKSGEKFETAYEVRPAPKARPLEEFIGDNELEDVLKARKDLSKVVTIFSYDELEELLDATDLPALLKRTPRKDKKSEDSDD